MPHTLESVRPQLDRLRGHLAGRDRPFEITVHAYELSGPEEVGAWAALGVDRLIVRPWTRTGEALDALRRFAAEYELAGR
jgi:hypothetical protein